ncbi:protoporphyrinogen oxidase HemJ [Parvibaculum sp.]|jgi:protoporphyrinogen IX oxidase|uniref:protoporphyrinogen oxidase HemJ n=1 Tax=Parvibaculum sp. TaxID=2024848 RepID=UPI001B17B2FF|nr:protoporphyrinogen oxidase HemJ [Parvibaculum sp.]MBO6634645.1 protoporphyrinogen oxidase HemJ [Parvibaculum sp.]MBO6677464.1 protoporphyrinogen oxidase HemJ [Parvibaculum sp.]MBO6685079.1 protoporphyrinogen oxidase HemJ [Parvibaculum sp.]MBO6903426.1 protoporphyrinogen oxidase HemJ [Parvibaculum sp.]
MGFLLEYYVWIKALHIISVIFWMAGMAYLPRLFVYHADAAPGSDKSETFKVMERRLLRGIVNPAMIATFFFGILMLAINPALFSDHWMQVKLVLILVMAGLHGMFSRWRKDFERDENTKDARFYRIVNEAPPVLVIFIVLLAVAKPF